MLNIEVEEPYNSATRIVKYVSSNNILLADEIYNANLKYPLECGCLDNNYVEYNPDYPCNDISKCITPIVYGCMDTTACNYDKNATFNIKELCCYPGYCNDRALNVVCPQLNISEFTFYIFPNPADDKFTIKYTLNSQSSIQYSIIKSDGTTIIPVQTLGNKVGMNENEVDIQSLNAGLYLFKLLVDGKEYKKTFVKN
jgi:hypothetical protein